KLEKVGIKPIEDLLVSLGLPARPPSAPSDFFSWEATAGMSRRLLGLNVLLSVQVAEDVRNTSINRVVVEQVTPGFSDRYLRQPDQFAHELQQYHKYIRSVIEIADNDTDAESFADDIISFSTSLALVRKITKEFL
ncbi:jg24242, partial [Pararge aegeria aegeria]